MEQKSKKSKLSDIILSKWTLDDLNGMFWDRSYELAEVNKPHNFGDWVSCFLKRKYCSTRENNQLIITVAYEAGEKTIKRAIRNEGYDGLIITKIEDDDNSHSYAIFGRPIKLQQSRVEKKILNFEEAINEILALRENSQSKPYIVSIHGYPGSGKSYASMELARKCVERNLRVKSSKPSRVRPKEITNCDLLLFNDTDVLAELVDRELEKTLRRRTDLKVLINNPSRYDMRSLYENYNFIINNPNARLEE